jgi:integrative and conjugative element protein (TIGR02256 family)
MTEAIMNKYSISQGVIEAIEIECRRNPENETGGILVGARIASSTIVTHCSGPGLIWNSSKHHFTKDTDYAQQTLNLLHEYFGVNYLGLWHKHPIEYPTPSKGDIANAMDEISGLNIELDELLTPICSLTNSTVTISPFVIREGSVHRIDWAITQGDCMVTNDLLKIYWYDSQIGRERLGDEVRRLEDQNLAVQVNKGEDGRCRIRVSTGKRKSQELVFLCPVDYPVSAPFAAILDKDTDTYIPVISQHISDWNMYKYISDIAKELCFT